jgi:type IX secretion system PorP/SprF family membrane protein
MLKITKRICFFMAMVCLQTIAHAQQDPQYSQYMFNTLAINPAYAGSRDVLSVTMLHRRQWTSVAGAPKSTTISADLPILNEKVGLGMLVYNDQIGVLQNNAVYFSYAQRIRLTQAGTLCLGLTGGGSFFTADLNSVSTTTPGDNVFASNINNKLKPNIGAGIYYTTDRWYVGGSMPRVFTNSLGTTTLAKEASEFRHYFIMAGFVSHLNSIMVLKPSFIGKAVSGAPLQVDLNLNLWFYDKIAIGGSYRTGDAVLGMLEVIPAQGWRLGYAYDFTISGLGNNLTAGSHEIMLRYEFASATSKILSPRYF